MTTPIEETQELHVLIESVSFKQNCFGVTQEGETVFIGNRIAGFLNLDIGDQVLAHVLPNYENHSAKIDYRAVRCVKVKVTPSASLPRRDDRPINATVVAKHGASQIQSNIIDILRTQENYLTTGECDEAYYEAHPNQKDRLHRSDVSNALAKAHQYGRIARAGVMASSSNEKASLVLWASDVNKFK
tara:strand:+ start:1205 stop:1765 length:561 start_codon:yes stop_codon:yes gene_type:complete